MSVELRLFISFELLNNLNLSGISANLHQLRKNSSLHLTVGVFTQDEVLR